jgi:hypothetical protein
MIYHQDLPLRDYLAQQLTFFLQRRLGTNLASSQLPQTALYSAIIFFQKHGFWKIVK